MRWQWGGGSDGAALANDLQKELAGPVAVEVWFVDLTAVQAMLAAQECSTPRLSAEDAKRLDDPERQNQRLAHIALRICIEAVGGPSFRTIPYARGPVGKPSFNGAGPHFSLAHTRRVVTQRADTQGVALVAVCRDAAVGVDIECERPVMLSPDRRAAIEAAAQTLSTDMLPDGPAENACFLQAWTRIEALAKYSGEGVGAILEATDLRRVKSTDGAGAHASSSLQATKFQPPPDIRVDDLPMESGIYASLARPAHLTANAMHVFPDGLGQELCQQLNTSSCGPTTS